MAERVNLAEGMEGLPLTIRRQVLFFAGGVRAGRHSIGQGVRVDENGDSHVRGAAYGNAEREMYGYTKFEAEALWRELERPDPGPRGGVPHPDKRTLTAYEGLLCEALAWLDEKRPIVLPGDGSAGRNVRYRERLHGWGFCDRGCGRPHEPGKTKCLECNSKAAEYVRAGRAKRKAFAAIITK